MVKIVQTKIFGKILQVKTWECIIIGQMHNNWPTFIEDTVPDSTRANISLQNFSFSFSFKTLQNIALGKSFSNFEYFQQLISGLTVQVYQKISNLFLLI